MELPLTRAQELFFQKLAICSDMSVLVAAPVALLAQGYNAIFLDDIDRDTLHGAFNMPIEGPHPKKINYALNKHDLVVMDEASMISSRILQTMASTFNRLNTRPVVILARDECKQQPLQTINGRITSITSIINDHTFSFSNAVIHTLYQQFHVINPEYARFLRPKSNRGHTKCEFVWPVGFLLLSRLVTISCQSSIYASSVFSP